jgi:hypothetical protein
MADLAGELGKRSGEFLGFFVADVQLHVSPRLECYESGEKQACGCNYSALKGSITVNLPSITWRC